MLNLIESEVQLVERAKRDPEAFGQLYQQHVDRIYVYIYYRIGDAREAEDLTARVFHRALARICDYDQRGSPFIAWLYRIAHNLVANWHRDRSRHVELPLESALQAQSADELPEQAAERSEEERILLEVVRRLPEERQEVLILKFVEEMSNAQIGKLLGRSEGAVKSLYHRTLLSLREELRERGQRQSL